MPSFALDIAEFNIFLDPLPSLLIFSRRVALAGLFFLPVKLRQRWPTFAVLMVVSLGVFTALSGCGGSSLPPVKSYNVIITGAIGTIQQICTVQLTVR